MTVLNLHQSLQRGAVGAGLIALMMFPASTAVAQDSASDKTANLTARKGGSNAADTKQGPSQQQGPNKGSNAANDDRDKDQATKRKKSTNNTSGSSADERAERSKSSKAITDDRIVRAIEERIALAEHVSANAINVSCFQGIVTLEGTVRDLLAKEEAADLSTMIRGVKSVVNDLIVRDSQESDLTVQSRVVTALATDPATESWEIAVAVDDGAVTLTGAVESYAESDLAESIAKSVKGVRKVDNNIDVIYTKLRRDAEIQEDIQQRLAWDARIADAKIDVSVDDGNVTISGTVGSAYEKELAALDAWVTGTKSVDSDSLEVSSDSRDAMLQKSLEANATDQEIKDAVKRAFVFDPRVYSFHPDITVEGGVVTLQGMVSDYQAKRAAERDAHNTVGVVRVKNLLKVQPDVTLTDSEIEDNIATGLVMSPLVDRYEITTSVIDGEAYLYGTVDSYYESMEATDVAARVRGVVDVHNRLHVDTYDVDLGTTEADRSAYRTIQRREDWEIQDDIDSQLWWSPFVDSDEVDVAVEDGVATLTGTVDSWSERESATENAVEGGAYKVINKLDVDFE